MNINIVASDLDSKFENLLNENNEASFYIKIADYGKYLIDTKSVSPYLKDLKTQSASDLSSYISACDKFLKKWNFLTSEILDMATKAGVVDDESDIFNGMQIAELKGSLNTKVSYDADYITRRYTNYIDLLNKLIQIEDINNFVPKHIILDKDGDKNFVLSLVYEKTKSEWDKFERIRKIRVWWAHHQIMRLTHGVFELDDKNGYFSNNRVIAGLYRYEFSLICTGITSQLLYLQKSNYLEWIKIFHSYLKPRLLSANEDGLSLVDEKSFDELSKIELRSKISNILKTGKFGKKERNFIRFLAKDFKPHFIKTIEEEINSKAGKQLKATLNEKLKNTGFSIEVIRADKWGAQAQYQLQYLT